MPTLTQLPKQVRDETKHRFLFNTSNLFLCGSPLGIFLHLDQTQIMPRKGRERTMHSPPDEAVSGSVAVCAPADPSSTARASSAVWP